MKKSIVLIVFGLALVTGLWLSPGPAEARANRTEFTAIDATCNLTPGVQSVSGNVLHIRGEVDSKQITSSQPLVAGTGTVVVNLNVNLTDGSGGGWGTFTLHPVGANGTWEGSFSGSLTADIFSGQGVANGTGALAGMGLTLTFQGIPIPQHQLCAPGPDLGEDNISGTIFNRSGN